MQQGTLGRGQQEGMASSPPGHGAGTGLGMAAPSRMIFKRRANATALPLHYSGHIQKKYTGEGGFRTYFGELRGSSLFFYSDEKQENYTERLELHDLNSMVPVASYSPRAAPIYTLSFPYEEVQLKIDNPDTGELWRGFILTVAKLDVPRDLQLLPGQFMMLENVKTEEQQRRVLLDQEKQRRVLLLNTSSADTPDSTDTDTDQEYDDSLSILPTCFLEVTREEAESQLLKNPESGSIILRPATDKKNYSATTRQDFPSGPVIKNYKIITTSDQQFTIQLDSPVTVSSLNAVVEYFMKETTNQLKPFTPRAYDTRIVLVPPVAPKPKMVPKARVAPTIHTGPPTRPLSTKLDPTGPPTRPLPPTPILQREESAYENEKGKSGLLPEKKNKKNQKSDAKAMYK